MGMIEGAVVAMHNCRRGTGVLFLLPLVVLPKLAAAIYLITYTKYGCTGDGVLLANIVPEICYDLRSNLNQNPYLFYRSLTFAGNPEVCEAYGYAIEWCLKYDQSVETGPGPICLTTSDTSGFFSAGIKCPVDFCPTQLFADRMKGARAQPQIAGVVYTEDPGRGSWILETADAKELFTQLTDVAEDTKVKWLRAQGASFQPAPKPSF